MPRARGTESGLTGILLVDKPPGWTSHDVVARVRGLSGQRQIGHSGTLDPMATGLLVLCLGRATRLVEYMVGHDKAYQGVIQLGTSTATDDAEGEVVERAAVPTLTADDLRRVAVAFTGRIEQVPPAYSAVKVAGQRAYAVARRGGAVALAARAVIVHELALELDASDRLRIDVRCGSGTYVRSLARDIGAALGALGHLAALRRTKVGAFGVDEAVPLAALTEVPRERFAELLLPVDEGVLDLDAAIVSDGHGALLAHGGRIQAVAERPAEHARVYTVTGEFVGIGAVDVPGVVRPVKVLTVPNLPS